MGVKLQYQPPLRLLRCVRCDCAAVGFADGIGGIQSQNIVGYNTVTIGQPWTIVAVGFENTAGGELSIQDAFPIQDGMTKGSSVTGDQIQIPDGNGGYDIYFLSDGNFKSMGKSKYDETRDGKWCNNDNTLSTVKIKSGTALWYGAKCYEKPFAISIAGAVAQDASKTFIVNLAWTLIANPYPTALALNGGIPPCDGMIKGSSVTGDQIQIPDGKGGYVVYFLSDGNFKAMGKSTYDESRDGKWCNSDNSLSSDSIPAGIGAWYGRKGESDFKITIASPIAK